MEVRASFALCCKLDAVSAARHHLGHGLHQAGHWGGQGDTAGGTRLGAMPFFVLGHERNDGARLEVLSRQMRQVLLQVATDLTFGFSDEAEADLVASEAGDGTDDEGQAIPERVEATGRVAEFMHAMLAPGEMIGLLARRLRHLLAHGRQPGGEGLPLVEGLGTDFAAVVDAHEAGGVPLLLGAQGGGGDRAVGMRALTAHRLRTQGAEQTIGLQNPVITRT